MHLTNDQWKELHAVTKLTPDELDRACAERMGWQIRTYSDGTGLIVNAPGGALAHRS